MGKSIMVLGTASGVGKTMLTLALCRIFSRDGYAVAPFKAQNMTRNTRLTASGEEIAVSQWLQALAAGVEPISDMNPVILKPSTEQTAAQVFLRGKYFDTVNAGNFREIKQKLAPAIRDAHSRLAGRFDAIILEGAGSPVELNLNKDDTVNMGMAKKAKSPVLLVADIDRGGVFAALYGTLNLMEDSERAYVKATIVNRFRGDVSLFAEGVKILEDITGLPVAGVIPYTAINLPGEDDLFGESVPRMTDLEEQFDNLADTARKSLDMTLIRKILNDGVHA